MTKTSITFFVAITLTQVMPTSANTPPQRIFISGHSLVDQPLPDNLESIAKSLGTAIQWNRQYMVGSSIRDRVQGRGPAAEGDPRAGYRQGLNRDGEGLDILKELHQPQTVRGGRYDTLLITEQHGLLGTLVWNDTVRYLRHYHEQFAAANPAGRTWFYESWLGIDRKSDPRRWIAYERAASPIWRCVATRINVSLAAEGRTDRIESLPAGLALAALVERATQGAGLAGISAGSVEATVSRLVADDVHLTPMGSYYISLVTYAYLFDRSPAGAWVPKEIDLKSGQALQALAWDVVQSERAARQTMTLADCQAALQGQFIATYWAYVRDAAWRRELNPAHAWVRWVKHRALWHWQFRSGGSSNPFRYDAKHDRDYWLPPR